MDFGIFLPMVWVAQCNSYSTPGIDPIGLLIRGNATVRHLWIQAAQENRRPVAGAVITPRYH
jgi:hypothetical protein